MIFTGLRKDKETDEIIEYELNVYEQDVAALYKDRYGAYICTLQGKMYKVKYSLNELREKLCL